MSMEVGADLWHTNLWESAGFYGGLTFPVGEGEHGFPTVNPPHYNQGSFIIADDFGDRYLREDENSRHGHMKINGYFHIPARPQHSYLVFDQAQMDFYLENNVIPEKNLNEMFQANTLAELSEITGMTNLIDSINKYNGYAASGIDIEFARAKDKMTEFGDGPYYAVEMVPFILNTQGGPRRNEDAQVIDVNGDPIPNLYSAGELGGITSKLYQGGGNIAETMIFGKITFYNC